MSPHLTIRAFLAAVRRRLRTRAVARAALYLVSAILFLAVAAPLFALATGAGATTLWLAGAAGAATLLASVAGGWLVPSRRWRSDRAVARYVGRRAPPIASDLLSAVELGEEMTRGGAGPVADRHRGAGFSRGLALALAASTSARLGELDPVLVVPRRPLLRPARALLVAAVVAGAAFTLAPARLARGWRALLHRPVEGRFAGATRSPVPLVGDLELTLVWPAYTGRPPTRLPNDSGEVRVLPGTRVEVETTALAPVKDAWIAFDGGERSAGDQNERPHIPNTTAGSFSTALPAHRRSPSANPDVALAVSGRQLRGSFEVRAPVRYRFLLAGPDGGRQVESATRAIEIEPDHPPRVELHAPADELDVTGLKRIELAYVADDDYGITRAELVWQEEGARTAHRMPLELPGGEGGRGDGGGRAGARAERPPRSAQDKLYWDLADVPLTPGVRVAYHIEVRDNDAVSGPQVGRSRELSLKVLSPRERHEKLLALERELFENMVHGLGGRLTVVADDRAAHQSLHKDAAGVVVELGTAVAALGQDPLAEKHLVKVLEEMRKRLDRLSRREERLLRRSASAAGLAASDKQHVAELEDDVVSLADWLDRQDLENLLAITDEIKTHRERLAKLFKEFERTHSKEIAAEIDRELRALQQEMAELDRQRRRMPADVLDQFVHTEALHKREADDCVAAVRSLMAAGKTRAAERKMRECGKVLDSSAQGLEQALDNLRGGKFSEQQKKFDQLRSELADLAKDQKEVADEAERLEQRYAEQAKQLMRQTKAADRDALRELLGVLKKRVRDVPRSGLGEFVDEEMGAVRSRTGDIERMLSSGDLAEALAMAREAEAGLEVVQQELEATIEDQEPGDRFRRASERALGQVNKARAAARRLVDALREATPSPAKVLGQADLEKLDKLRRRQQALQQQAERLSKRAQAAADELPGEAGQRMGERLDQAGQKMGRAGQRMRARDPSGARADARDAAEKLAQAEKEAQGAARQQQSQGRAGLHDEPIRIPGADEYKPPQKFREDILNAMKKDQGPSSYRDMLKRYYEELIR